MKGIEWIKANTSMCDDEKMRLIDSMECRDAAFYLWIRFLLQAGKVNDNGLIYLKKDVPYTNEMFSILFNRPIEIIEKVLEILESFRMIKIYENNIIKICNWEKHQNIEGMKRVREGNRERVKNFREKKKKENVVIENENSNSNETSINAEGDTNKTNEINKNKNCNANVTLQKEKREEDKENKKKNIDIRERGEDTENIYIKENEEKKANWYKDIGEHDSGEKLEAQGLKLIKSLEKISVSIKGLTLRGLQDMLAKHKEEFVKMAIGKAIERNKLDINYINGILKNWLREGYPKSYEEMEFDNYSGNNLVPLKEKKKLSFINFEARKYDYEELEKKLLGW